MTSDPQPRTGDPIGVTLASIAVGACAGGSIVTGSTLLVRTLQGGQPDQSNPLFAAVLTAGVVIGVTTGITTAFVHARSIDNLWRRSVVGAIAMFGTALVSLISLPFEMIGGRPGLIIVLALLITGTVVAHRKVSAAVVP